MINEGLFYELVNLVVVWNLLVIFFIINNCYGILIDIIYLIKIFYFYMCVDVYGILGYYVEDGNDFMVVYEKMYEVINYVCLGNGLVIVEVELYCWFGYLIVDVGVYCIKEEVDLWKVKDLVKCYCVYLIENEIVIEEEFVVIEV